MPGNFETPPEIEALLGTRNEGCSAILRILDTGDETSVSAPVCMDGRELVGCNDSDTCVSKYQEKVAGDGYVHISFLGSGNKIVKVIAVPERPLKLDS